MLVLDWMKIQMYDVCPLHFRCDEVDSNRLRPHLLRTSDYCWCDKDAMNRFAEVQYRT